MRGITRAIWLLLPVLVISASLTIASSEEMRAGVVTGIQGTARVTRASLAEPRDLGFKDDVYLRDQIVTGDASMARILLGGKALLTVRERSIVTITEVPGVSTVSVTSGRAAVNVMKDRMRPGDSVEIVTPNATAAIRGTIVVAEVDPDPAGTRSTITVLRGLIDVTQNDGAGRAVGSPVSVSALQQVMALGNGLSPVQPISRQTADRLANDFKMGLRAAPAAPSMVQSEIDRAVQQVVSTKDTSKDTSKDSGDKPTDSAKGDSKSSDGKGGDTKTAGGSNGGSGGGSSASSGGSSAAGGSSSTGGGNSTAGGSTGGTASGSATGASTASVSSGGPSTGGGSTVGGGAGNSGGNDRVAIGGGGNVGLDRIGGGGGNDRDRDRDRDKGDKGNKDRGGKKR
jgi:hypothetical protein